MFDKAKDMYKLQKQARKIKKQLKNTHIEAEENGVIVTMNGEQEIVNVHIPDEALTDGKKLAATLEKCFNKAIKRSQQVGAELMKEVMGDDFSLPGM